MICLDTHVVVALLTGGEAGGASPVRHRATGALFLSLWSALVLFELRFGADNSLNPERNHRTLDAFLEDGLAILDFDLEDAREVVAIRAGLRAKVTPIGPYDTLIAAQARRRGATLVTANTREFERVPGLQVVDWGSG